MTPKVPEDIGERGARLVARVRAGDREAWSELIDAFGGLVLRATQLAGLSHADAEEVFQETWTSLYRQLSSLQSPTALASWITRTAVRQCAFVRHRRIKSGAVPDLPEDQPFPEHELERLEQAGIVREEAQALPARCRELLQLLFFEQHTPSYVEIAERLGLGPDSVGSTRRRCLGELAERLERRGLR